MTKTSSAKVVQEKRIYISQSDMPKLPLSETLRLAQSLFDDFAGKSAAPHQLAMSVATSPTSSTWDKLCGAAMAYGLTEGGSKADKIVLADLGKKIVAPTTEGEDEQAKVEAVFRPRIIREFFQKYNRARFPSDIIARNVLGEMGVPNDRLDEALEIIKRNGEFVGLIHQTKTGAFVALNVILPPADTDIPSGEEDEGEIETGQERIIEGVGPPKAVHAQKPTERQKVFITHGNNKEIVAQLKELLMFGKLEPVVAEEHETTSKPVPDKVLDDMRACFAGIIHIASEDELLDRQGNVHHKLNENVLIEIGAAFALYGRNVILLVQKGVNLPSNLQGLYRCYYEGSRLDYEATMKLLKAFNEFE